jgi:mycofactocin biosynthesis protein MftB
LAPAFELGQRWHLHPQVALRDESFGALAYHYGTRRLHFLKSRPLVDLVISLDRYDSAGAAIDALIPEKERELYGRALARLAASGVLDAD